MVCGASGVRMFKNGRHAGEFCRTGTKKKRSRLLADARILGVFGDADELASASLSCQAFAKRAAALPVALAMVSLTTGDERGLFVIGAVNSPLTSGIAHVTK